MAVAGTIQFPELGSVPDGEGTNWQLACTEDGLVAVAPDGEEMFASPESRCAFLAYKSADQLNVVGDTTPYEVTVVFGTELFDVGSNFASNVFTAPATGRYLLVAQVMIGDRVGAAHPTSYLKIVTSNRTYRTYHHWVVWGTITTIAIADMDTADTARVTLFANGTSQTGGVYRGMETRFMGMRVTR